MKPDKSEQTPLYLDYNATTPLDPRVFEAMKPWFLEVPGNAGSRTHVFGQWAKEAVEKARQQVADLIGAVPEEIIFTSGATESNNLAILGLAQYGMKRERMHVLSTAIEHKAVLEPLTQIQKLGFEIELLPVTAGGYVEPDIIKARLRQDTLLVSVMHGNNETGVLQSLEPVSELIADTEVLFHTDAAQTFGKDVETLKRLRCDFMSVSGHKIYGPKGIGALYVRRRCSERRRLSALLYGGGQERGLRPGTLPVPLAVGLGEAARLAGEEYLERRRMAQVVKSQLLTDLLSVEHEVNGDLSRSQSHVVNVCFPGIDSEALMLTLRNELAISNGSACTSASYQPSHVLQAMGLDEDAAQSSVRFSWGPGVSYIPTEALVQTVNELRM